MKILASACLVGTPCRYNATPSPHSIAEQLFQQGYIIPVCPEILGGLPTPRTPAEICQKNSQTHIFTKAGADVTNAFMTGCKYAVCTALEHKCPVALVKTRSPSCGYGQIYDGTFTGTLVQGNGVFVTMLLEQHIQVFSSEDHTGFLQFLRTSIPNFTLPS